MESKAQKKANMRWKRKNKNKQDYYRNKSAAKKFILFQATLKDIKMMEKLLHDRSNIISKQD